MNNKHPKKVVQVTFILKYTISISLNRVLFVKTTRV